MIKPLKSDISLGKKFFLNISITNSGNKVLKETVVKCFLPKHFKNVSSSFRESNRFLTKEFVIIVWKLANINPKESHINKIGM